MATRIGSTVRPWYKGTHEWQVEGIAELPQHIGYTDSVQGDVGYSPKILALSNSQGERALWFAYWISTSNNKGKLKWGQGPPVLEEEVLLTLLKEAISKGLFTSDFLAELARELEPIQQQ
jgi:hypothetical protein